MFASSAGKARLFLDNFDGAGSKAFDFGYPRLQAGDDPYPDPSQSSAVAPTSPGTFSGMTYQGCYSDPGSVLPLKAYSRDDNTIDSCTATCAGQGYKIAGLEYGVECWCGNTMGYKAQVTTDQACTMACAGNSTQICGNSYRLSVFSTGNITSAAQPSSPTQVGSYSLLGCYSEASSGRALSERSTSQSDMTVETCATYCSGYKYFGVEYGAEIYVDYVYNNFRFHDCVGLYNELSLYDSISLYSELKFHEFRFHNELSVYIEPSIYSQLEFYEFRFHNELSLSNELSLYINLGLHNCIGLYSKLSLYIEFSLYVDLGLHNKLRNRNNYLIECYTDHYAGDMLTTTASTLELCIEACDTNSGCVDVAWVYGSCYLKSSVGTAISNNAVLGAKLITTSSSSSSSSSSTTTTTAAAASSTTTSSTSSTSATPSASTLSCPTSDGQTFTAPRGQLFTIECGTDHFGGDMGAPTYPGSFAACVAQCDATDGCVDVAYISNGPCYLKSTLGASISNPNIWGAKLAASLPSGITARGCYVDGAGGARAFPTQIYSNSSNTPCLCASACREKGFKYAGTQYGTECWCGSSLPTTTAPASDCSSACAGDARQKCGGGFRLSVTDDTAWTQRFFARQAYGGWSLVSCYQDNVDGKRTLATNVAIGDASAATIAKCLDACAAGGFAYCGAEYYYECYGGASKPADSLVVADATDPLLAGCNYACSGNSTEACGGANKLLVYVNNGI
ncbi:WSC domain-containing protein [Lasiodiplodia hormozganensis]|nr:WSC domain-containing protein [Lasiodiplodia hormozganensis]